MSSKQKYTPTPLPLSADVETRAILRKLPQIHAALAEFKGVVTSIPNTAILINTLSLQEAKDSSAVENIITTHDELFKAELNLENVKNVAAKEVQNYAQALKIGYELVKNEGILRTNTILKMHKAIEQNNAGFRKLPGTELKNQRTGQVVYTPPQDEADIKNLMANLAQYINDDTLHDADPLIKLAIIHHQFESIHPFYDGNGRLGRIINILYLILKDLQDYPILYLSRYINQNKSEYYRLLQKVRDDGDWESWIMYMLNAVEIVSRQGIEMVAAIKNLMLQYKHHIRDNHPFYRQELLNNLFKHPYTKIEFVQDDLNVTRKTAAKYLNTLADDGSGLVEIIHIGKHKYYVNTGLFGLFLHQELDNE